MPERRGSVLSDKRILEEHGSGNIVIDPFQRENVKTSSVDVTLGEWFYRPNPNHGLTVFNPWSEDHVKRVFGEPQRAKTAREEYGNNLPDGVEPEDRIIIAEPGKMLLCHTQEFIGGVSDTTTEMKARSSIGRVSIVVCNCAGWGDVGYFNRWTMEVTANGFGFDNPLPELLFVGRRVAQITFQETGPILGTNYSVDGKYQMTSNIDELKGNWSPTMMLPRLYKDREIKR